MILKLFWVSPYSWRKRLRAKTTRYIPKCWKTPEKRKPRLNFIRVIKNSSFDQSFKYIWSRHPRSSPPEVFLRKDILKKLLWNFFEITLRHGYPPVNLMHISRIPLSKNLWKATSNLSNISSLAKQTYSVRHEIFQLCNCQYNLKQTALFCY